MKLRRKKPEWELQAFYDEAVEKLESMESTEPEYEPQIKLVLDLEARKRRFEDETSKKRLSADGKAAVGCTLFGISAPYIISALGKLPAKVQLPNMWSRLKR